MRAGPVGAACLAVMGWGLHLAAQEPPLADRVQAVLERSCFRCHGQNGAVEGGFGGVLNFAAHQDGHVVPGQPDQSRLFKRISNESMPPEGEEPRPTPAEIELIRQWIAAGAPAPTESKQAARPFVGLLDEYRALRDFVRRAPRDDRRYLRFFTLRHLHNLPDKKVSELQLYRAALSKLVNSLSWKHGVVVPEVVDPAQTLLAVDVRDLDWDRNDLWQQMRQVYPYALVHDQFPEEPELNDLAAEVYQLTGTDVPVVRVDWFIATASRPPLYHALLQIPESADVLEQRLGVPVRRNFVDGKLARAGFNASGVSSSNRLVERHDSPYGAYWKSYDFKVSAGLGNLFVFPLGPKFPDNPFQRQAFDHDGGEIIFNLPNGLQGYMLVDGRDQRIDVGPIQVVSDGNKITGTPEIINGLSCMACHQHGMIRFRDSIREGHILGGPAREHVRRIYPAQGDLDRLLDADGARFVTPLQTAMGRFLPGDDGRPRNVKDIPEPVSAIAKWYLVAELTAVEAARELGLEDPAVLQGAIRANPRLQELGLFPLTREGGTIKRQVWEFNEFLVSPFQETAGELRLGTPRVR